MASSTKLFNTDAEREVIAACIFDTSIYDNVRDMLSVDLFSDYECKKVYDVMLAMDSEGLKPDFVSIVSRMQGSDVEVKNFLQNPYYSIEVTKQRIELLRELSIRRKLQACFFKGQTMSEDTTLTMEDLQHVMNELSSIINQQESDEVQKFGEVVESLINDVANRKEDRCERGMMTGLWLFDSRFGLHGGDLVIIAGASSTGKSTLATTIAYNLAKIGIPVAYYSLEMSSKQLTARMIARDTNVSSSTTLYGKVSDDEYNRIYDNGMALAGLPIYFDENSKTSFVKICGSIRRMVRTRHLKVAIVDYLQILANSSGDNREQLLGDMARDFKRLAVEEDICVILLSQLNRSGDRSKEPDLSQMRGSGQIEEACDTAVLVHRPVQGSDTATLLLRKGRNIGTGKCKVQFNGGLCYFSDMENIGEKNNNEDLPF